MIEKLKLKTFNQVLQSNVKYIEHFIAFMLTIQHQLNKNTLKKGQFSIGTYIING